MKRTDQDGLLIGPGINFTNIFGEGIHQEFLNRYTAVPEPFRAKEFLSYTHIPEMYFFPFTTEITINYFESYNSLKLYNEKSVYSQGSIMYKLTKEFKIVGSGSSLSVKHDNDAPVFTSGNKSMKMFQGKKGWDYVPSLGAGFILDTREREMNPHYGFYNEIKASVYGEKLGGDSDYREYLYDFRGYIPAGRKHIFHANMLAQYRPGVIPGYELYHIGGINTLRTYEPDPSICGQHEVLGTIEYRYELFANRQISLLDMHGYYGLQLVLGMDNAACWFPGEDFSQGNYLNSFFAGIHLLVPVLERVRLEFGFHGPYRDENEVRFGINFGWYEKAYTQRRRVR
jgi:outer membrane protein assembly factor BamA